MQTTLSPPRDISQPPIDASPIVRERFNKQPFEFTHHLADHPLFQLPRLLELATSNPDTYYDVGEIRVDQRWRDRPAASISIRDAFEHIDQAGAWVVIRHAEKDPEYRELLDQCLNSIGDQVDQDFRRIMKSQEAIIFVTSPGRLTSYHIDRECNFLLQVSGSKTIHVFDRTDREVLTEQEIERFWTVDNDCAIYREQFQNRAHTANLVPGTAVHIPVNCPHWLKNGDGVSISLSVSFQYPDDVLGDLYRVNHYLRRLGISPRPPGISQSADSFKRRFGGTARHLTRALQYPSYCLWRYRQWKKSKRS